MNRLIPLISLIIAITAFFVYIRPTYSGPIHTTREQIKSYDNALAAADRFQEKEAQLSQAKAQIPAESLSRLSEFLPDGVDNVQLILDMDALAARSGITLSDFDTKNTDGTTSTFSPSGSSTSQSQPGLSLISSSPVDSINLTFKASGTYSSFRTFLAGIENSLRPLDVVALDVTDSATGVYTYSVTVRIYWLR